LLNLSGVRQTKSVTGASRSLQITSERLKDDQIKGNHHKATEKYIEILLETIDKAPQELGYEFGRWSAKRLATYLEEVTGIKLSGSQGEENYIKKKVRLPMVKI
jgi:transposase